MSKFYKHKIYISFNSGYITYTFHTFSLTSIFLFAKYDGLKIKICVNRQMKKEEKRQNMIENVKKKKIPWNHVYWWVAMFVGS